MGTRILVQSQAQMSRLIEQLQPSACPSAQEKGQRHYWRTTYQALGTFEVKKSSEYFEPIYITIHDISLAGLEFTCHRRLPIGQKIVLAIETNLGTSKSLPPSFTARVPSAPSGSASDLTFRSSKRS